MVNKIFHATISCKLESRWLLGLFFHILLISFVTVGNIFLLFNDRVD